MILCDDKYIIALKRVLKRIDYTFLVKSMRGVGDFVDPWYDYARMRAAIAASSSPYKATLALLQMGADAEYAKISAEIGEADAQALIACGLWRREGDTVRTNNLVALVYEGIVLLTEINPWFKTCQNRNTDVYIGSDSLRLAENIVFDRGSEVLDLCSGTGIQGLLAARSAKKVVSVEINPKTTPVTRFNIRLNGLEDVVELREGDLYSVLGESERFDYIYANPPFIPMVEGVDYPICGSGGTDGLMVLNRIFDGLPERLKPGGEVIVFCECLGDSKNVFFDERVMELGRENGWRINAMYNNRIRGNLQILKMAKLARLFGDNFDEKAFCERMKGIYAELGAEYLYSLLYKIDACGRYDFRRANLFNPWQANDGATVGADIVLQDNPDSRAVIKDGEQIGAFNIETANIWEKLKSGLSVEQTAQSLWDEYRGCDKYALYGYPAFVEAMLATCGRMESIGAVTRRVGNGRCVSET